MNHGILLFISMNLGLLSFMVIPIGSATAASETPLSADNHEDVLQKSLVLLEDTRQLLSEQLITISDDLDHLLGSERVKHEGNGTELWLMPSLIWSEGGRFTQQFATSMRLDLPRTNDRFSLVIRTDEKTENPEGKSSQPTPAQNTEQAISNTPITAAVQYVFQESDEWSIRASTGMRFDASSGASAGKRAEPTTTLRARRLFVSPPWETRITETLFWFAVDGVGETTEVDFERPFLPRYFFRATTTGTWRENTEVYEYSQSLKFYKQFGPKRAVTYAFLARGDNQFHTTIDEYEFVASHRMNIHKTWVYWTLAYHALYPRVYDFDYTPSLVASIELVFNDKN